MRGRGDWVASSGNVTDEAWVEYIKNQTPPEPDDNVRATYVRRRRTNPALSRNSKPPPLGGGVFTWTVSRNHEICSAFSQRDLMETRGDGLAEAPNGGCGSLESIGGNFAQECLEDGVERTLQ